MKKLLIFFLTLTVCSMQARSQATEQSEPAYSAEALQDGLIPDEAPSYTEAAEDTPLPFVHPVPEFKPVRLRAQAPAASAADDCPVDSIESYDPDGKLISLLVYRYDNQGRTIETTTWTWIDGRKTGVSKEETQFADNGQQLMTATWTWDSETNNWRGSEKNEYAYDEAGRTVQWDIYTWGTDDWTEMKHYTYSFNAAGKPLESAEYVYDPEKNAWAGVTKSEYAYDAANRTLLALTSTWDATTGDWVPQQKYEYAYDAAGNKTLDAYYSAYNAATGKWTGSTKTEYTYDENSRNTLTLTSTWDTTTDDWVPQKKHEYTYNAAGKTTLDAEYSAYDAATGKWTGSTKTEYTYDEGNRNLLKLTSTWDATAGDWVPKTKYEYEYDAAGNTTLDAYYSSYNTVSSTWIGNYKKIYLYNASKKKLLDEQYTWDTKKTDWKGKSKTKYEYNSDGKATLTLKYTWVTDTWTWRENTKTEQEYDTKKRETDRADYSWDKDNNAWKGTSRTATTYTSAGKKETVITFTWTDGDWVNDKLTGYAYSGSLTTEEYTQTWNGTEWVNNTRKTWSYKAGKTEAINTYKWMDGDWQNQTRELHTYNDLGEETLIQKDSWTDGDWTTTSMSRTDIKRDEAGRVILNATWECSSDLVWKGKEKSEWTYNEAGAMLIHAEYTFNDEDWVPTYKVEWEYDEAGRRLNEQRNNYSEGTWYPAYWYHLAYDEKGRELLSEMYIGSGKDWVGSFRNEHTYADNGEIAQDISYTWKNNNWTGIFRITYTYDDNKRIIERIQEQYNENGWYNETRFVFDYNAHGLETVNNEYTWLDSKWVFQSRNEKEYDESDDKLRTELTATYEDGTESTYDFRRYYYACDAKYYTVRFLNWDGTELQADKLLEGTKPAYKGETPAREKDAQYTYTFAGWDKEIAAVTDNTDYKAVYNTTVNQYLITFYNEDGVTELQASEVDYGTVPAYNGETPAKAADVQYTYTFAGWDNELTAVTGTASYKATYTQTLNKYTVIFYNEDGVTELQASEFEYGTVPVYNGETPTKAADEQYTYIFNGWDQEIVAVTGEASYKATYRIQGNKFLVIFYDEDGVTELQASEVDYGTVPVYNGEIPTKAADAQYTYAFAGWDQELTAVTGATSYKATYSTTVNKYTVVFYDEDGVTELQASEFEYGTVPVYNGETPTKAADEQYTYIFNGWDQEIVAVTGEASYKATYRIQGNKFLVIFYDEDGVTELQASEVDYGTVPVYNGEIPTKAADAQYTYAFAGWDNELTAVTGTASYKATYTQTLNKYTVIFYNEDGVTELQASEFEYGTVPVYNGETPTKAADAQYTYAFAGWDNELTAVTGAASYKATYSTTVNKYLITFYDGDGVTKLDEREWEYGATPTCEEPTKEGNSQYSYRFFSWDKDIVAVTENAVYIAQYEQIVNQYIVTFYDEDGTTVLWSGKFDYGKVPSYGGETPATTSNAQYTHLFTGWDKELTAVTSDASYTARYEDVLNKYTVTATSANDEMGSVTGSGEYEYGTNVTLTPVANEGYMFIGWSNGSMANPYQFEITDNVTLVANFQEEIKADEIEDELIEAQAEATKTSVTVTWPAVEDAVLYTIEISNNEEVIITLSFNNFGQLLSSSSPARDRQNGQSNRAAQIEKGWQYTVHGLDADTEYTYTVTALKADESVAYKRSIAFQTLGTTTDMAETNEAAGQQTIKVVEKGVLYIIRDGVRYTTDGKAVQ